MPGVERPKPFDEEATITVDVRVGDLFGESLRVEKKLGDGGTGTVWSAWDTVLERRVAVKLLAAEHSAHSELVARFEKEARAMARLDHPNIVPVYSVGRRGTRPYLVMKYLDGFALDEYRANLGGKIAPAALLPMLRQVCAGLTYLHDAGFVHRDLKPGNLFLVARGHVYVLDLGVVRETRNVTTRAGSLMGTPAYMSPEQASAERELDHRSDIYSLGVVLFECLTGTLPFDDESDVKVLMAHLESPVPSLLERSEGLPAALDAVVRRALAKDPAQRHQKVSELLADCERVMGGVETLPARASVSRARVIDPQLSKTAPNPAHVPSQQKTQVDRPRASRPGLPAQKTDEGDDEP